MSDECCDNVKSAEGLVGCGTSGQTYKPTLWDKHAHKLYQMESLIRPAVYMLAALALIKYITG